MCTWKSVFGWFYSHSISYQFFSLLSFWPQKSSNIIHPVIHLLFTDPISMKILFLFEPMKEKQPWIRTIIVTPLIHTSYHSYLGKVHNLQFFCIYCVSQAQFGALLVSNLWMCRRKTPSLLLAMATRTQHKPTFAKNSQTYIITSIISLRG